MGPGEVRSTVRKAARLFGAALLGALALAAPAAADDAPYGLNDAGGFRNVLPAGEGGTDNVGQLAAFQANDSALPPHFDDQLGLYTGLVSASPALTHDQIPNYFKDATFGVRPGDVESTEHPRPGLTIVRDRYGVPHIYGATRGDVMFGTGWAGAEDRLFLMDILRHTGRAQLSSFAGGAAGNRAMDRTQWALAPYTEADLQSQIDHATEIYGAAGQQVVNDVNEYVAGINAYIDMAVNPLNAASKLPGEYAAFGKVPQHFTPTDVIATASLIGGIFGKGGGSEVNSALTLQAFQRRFGDRAGRTAWLDFRSKNDPEAPTTVAKPFPYETASPFASRGLAIPDLGSVRFTPPGPPVSRTSSATATRTTTPAGIRVPDDGSIGSRLARSLFSHGGLASNWELISKRRSANGHAIAVMGPQVGYYVPEILMEEDLHGPGIDARGAAFPGVNLFVQLGHGRDYAWSATTATSDNVDTFAEVLCQDDVHYLYRGTCTPMEKLDDPNSWTPNGADQTPAGSETLTAYRTVHGIVYARGTVGGRPVAFASARTTYFHEADSALGFLQLNDPNFITSPQRFQEAASNINFGFNWSFVNADHIAYYHSGWYPQRAPRTSTDFPILGTGEYDWGGYDPRLHTLSVLPFGAHPNAIDPDYLVSWNNKQAPSWSAADDKYAFGSVYRSQMIEALIRRDLSGRRKMRIEQLVHAMEEPATQDIRSFALWPSLKRVLGTPSDPKLRAAIAVLDGWYARGAHRRDLNRDGRYDDDAAVTLMDAWWPRLVAAEFRPTLGADAFDTLRNKMLPTGATDPASGPSAPDFADGWYGYVSKDLRDLLNPLPVKRKCRTVRRRVRTGGRVRTRRVRVCTRPKAKAKRSTAQAAATPKRRTKRRTRRKVKPKAPAVRGRYSRVYCGNGSRTACRAALLASLSDALGVSRTDLYGQSGACKSDAQASCFDKNRWTIASAISIPPFAFQNRPTFQQVIEVTRTLGR
jgi:acyl-homoserine lactone acylase PvdQ